MVSFQGNDTIETFQFSEFSSCFIVIYVIFSEVGLYGSRCLICGFASFLRMAYQAVQQSIISIAVQQLYQQQPIHVYILTRT